MRPLAFVESLDLTAIYLILCIIGILLCLYVMQLFAIGVLEMIGDPPSAFWARRSGLAIVALSLCWCLFYSIQKGWQPWPPDLLLVAGLDLLLLSGIFVAGSRKRLLK